MPGRFGDHRERPANGGAHKPVRETAERLALRSDGVRENFRDKDPNDRALRDAEKGDEAQNRRNDDKGVRRVAEPDLPSGQQVHNRRADGAEHQQETASETVDQEERGDRREKIDRAEPDRNAERGLLADEHFENARRVIVDRVDAGNLVKHRDGPSEENRRKISLLEERNVLAAFGFRKGRGDFAERRFGGNVADAGENFLRFLRSSEADELARAFRNREEEDEEERRRERLDAELEPPNNRLERKRRRRKASREAFASAAERAGGVDLRDVIVRNVRNENTENDIQLVQGDQTTAHRARRRFDDVKRNDDRRTADRETAEPTHKDERRPVRRERATDRRNEVKDRHRDQNRLATENVGRTADSERADNRPDQRDRDREAVPKTVQTVFGLNRFFAAGDDAGVETEEETAERGNDNDVK